jgi:hypothetical protein
MVTLLDRRVEGVEIGVQDRGFVDGHEHMFARYDRSGNTEFG